MDKIPRIILIISTFSLLLGFISAINFYQDLEEKKQQNKQKKENNTEQVIEKEEYDLNAGNNELTPAIKSEENDKNK